MDRSKAPKKRIGLNNKLMKVRSSTKIPELDKRGNDKKSVEMHFNRLDALREIANNLKEDSWKFESLKPHLGL